jgi:ADP-heptose:LPS heptosyltransferase
VVALYGPTDPARKGPLGRGPSLVIRAEAQEGRAMSSITPERVLRAIDEARFL